MRLARSCTGAARYHSGARVPRASCPPFLSRLSPFVPYSSPFYPALALLCPGGACALVTRRAPVEWMPRRGDPTGRPHVMQWRLFHLHGVRPGHGSGRRGGVPPCGLRPYTHLCGAPRLVRCRAEWFRRSPSHARRPASRAGPPWRWVRRRWPAASFSLRGSSCWQPARVSCCCAAYLPAS